MFEMMQTNPGHFSGGNAAVPEQLQIESTELHNALAVFNSTELRGQFRKDVERAVMEMDVIEAKFLNIQRSNEEQRHGMAQLEHCIEQFEVEVDTVNHQRTTMTQEFEHDHQMMELEYRTSTYEHQVGMATLQEAVTLLETRGQELQDSCQAWEERYAALQSQRRSEQAGSSAKCQGLEMERDELRMQLEAGRAECIAARLTEESLQAQVLQLRSERTDTMLQNEMFHETEMNRLREMLNVASTKEATLVGELQETNFSNKMQAIEVVQVCQDLCRTVGRMKGLVGEAVGMRLERSTLLDTESISLETIRNGDTFSQASSDLRAAEDLVRNKGH